MATTKPARTFECDECGRSFPTKQALGGHKTKHARDQREGTNHDEPKLRFSVTAQVAEAMREVIAPLRLQLTEINARIDTAAKELAELRVARQQLEGILKKLDPTSSRPTSTNANAAQAVRAKQLVAKTDTLRTLTQEHPELFADGVTANSLADTWKNLGLQPASSLVSIRAGLETLRDEGIMRADKVTKGGGMSWKLVTDNGGAPDAS